MTSSTRRSPRVSPDSPLIRTLRGSGTRCATGKNRATRPSTVSVTLPYTVGITALVLLAFLEDGHTYRKGEHKKVVREGFRFLKEMQDPEGCYGPRESSHFVYNHAIATLAMVRHYQATKVVGYKRSAEAGVEFILKARNPGGAWRYGIRPKDNDSSVTGWMVAALSAARDAGFKVDEAAFREPREWIDRITNPKTGKVGYDKRDTGPARPGDLLARFPAASLRCEYRIRQCHPPALRHEPDIERAVSEGPGPHDGAPALEGPERGGHLLLVLGHAGDVTGRRRGRKDLVGPPLREIILSPAAEAGPDARLVRSRRAMESGGGPNLPDGSHGADRGETRRAVNRKATRRGARSPSSPSPTCHRRTCRWSGG